MAIKIMLVDDHVLIREGIRQLLEFDGSIEVISEASDGEECLDKIICYKPNLLLLDINMPKKNGLDVLAELRQRNIDVKVLILTVHNEIEYLVKAVDMGVDGYILKDSKSDELKKAILSILDGEKYIQSSLIPALNNRLLLRNDDKLKINSLSKREVEVLCYVANGLFNKDIAEKMCISERTVKNHITNIFKKLNVLDRTQAAVFAIKNDIVKI